MSRSVRAARSLIPGLADFSFSTFVPMMSEFRACLEVIHSKHTAVATDYLIWDSNFVDHTTFGDKTFQYHPRGRGLPTIATLPTIEQLNDPDSKISCATRTTSLRSSITSTGSPPLFRLIEATKDAFRMGQFISTCQTGAGDYLNVPPSHTAHHPTGLARTAT